MTILIVAWAVLFSVGLTWALVARRNARREAYRRRLEQRLKDLT